MSVGMNFYTAAGLFAVLGVMLLGLVATCPAVKAFEKGRQFVKWYIFSFLVFPIAFPASFAIHGSRDAQKVKKSE